MKTMMIVAGVLVSTVPFLAAIEPADIASAAAAVRNEDPEAVVLEIDREYHRGAALVTAQTDSGFEYYVHIADAQIVDRERERVDWEDQRIADEIRGSDEILSLPTAYEYLLERVAEDSSMPGVNTEYLSSMEYDVEYRNLVIQISFEGPGIEVEVYMDPYSGEIISYELDD